MNTSQKIDLSADRTAAHTGDPSQRVLSEGHDRVGLAGEFAFAEFAGVHPNTKRGRDPGYDFRVPMTITVDVRTARHPKFLLHEQGKPFSAFVYVLAKYHELPHERAELTSAAEV